MKLCRSTWQLLCRHSPKDLETGLAAAAAEPRAAAARQDSCLASVPD